MAPPKKIHFIMMTDPTHPANPQTRKELRSHAARETHAKRRRVRADKHQAEHSTITTAPLDGSSTRALAASRGSSSSPLGILDIGSEKPLSSSKHGISPLELISSYRKDPFSATARDLTPHDYFFLSYYVETVIPDFEIHCRCLLGDLPERGHTILKGWVQPAIGDIGLLSGLLLSSCRHLFYLYRTRSASSQAEQLVDHYKLVGVRELREAIRLETASTSSEKPYSTMTIAKCLALAVDEMAYGDLESFVAHLKGAFRMVQVNGGPDTLPTGSFIKHIYNRFMSEEAHCYGLSYKVAEE